MKPETFQAYVDNVKRANAKGNAHLFPGMNPHYIGTKVVPDSPKRIRQSGRPVLNKLESEFLAYQQARYPGVIFRCQAITFKLANGLRFTPDIVNLEDGIAWEVKGPHAFDGALDKLKMAAAVYKEFSWLLAWKYKPTGVWTVQQVLPDL